MPTVAVVGAGPAGLSTAIALSQRGINSIVIDREKLARRRFGEHLSPEARPMLGKLGCAGILDNTEHLITYGVHSAWGQATLIENHYAFSPYGFSYHLSRPSFDITLAERLLQLGGQLLEGSPILSIERSERGYLIGVRHQHKTRTIAADFVVDASGRAATIACWHGVERIYDDHMIGIIALLKPKDPSRTNSDSSLLLEAQKDGWWYAAPLSSGELVVGYLSDPDIAFHDKQKPEHVWRTNLEQTEHIRVRVAQYEYTSIELIVCTAASQYLKQFRGENWLATGDAAASFDPLSSSGLRRALTWGYYAAEAITGFFEKQLSALESYQQMLEADLNDYKAAHQMYYQMERRWASSLFWHRRHKVRHQPQNIWLDPMLPIVLAEGKTLEDLQKAVQSLNIQTTSSDLNGVIESRPKAHILAQYFKMGSKDELNDIKIIHAIQTMLDDEVLSTSA